jgi:hypothetical protein
MAMTQRKKSLVTLGSLLAVAAATGLFAYYGVFKKQEAEKAAKEKKETLFADLDKTKIKELKVTAKGETTVLTRKQPEGWEIVSPLAAEAEKNVVDSLVDRLAELKSKATIEEKSQNIAKYGLDKPSIEIVAKVEGGGELRLRAGAENSFDDTIYVAVGDSSDVLLSEGGLKWSLEKNTFDLRDKRLLRFEEAAAKELEVRVGKSRYSLSKQSGKWQLASPMADRADESTVNRILGALGNLRAVKIAADHPSPAEEAKHGLAPPRLEATLTLDGGTQLKLQAGEAEEGGTKKFYARGKEATFIAEVPESVFTDLDVKVIDLRDKTVLAFEREKVQGIRFELSGETVAVEKVKPPPDGGTGDEWKVTAPAPGEAKKWKMGSLLWTLSGLKGKSFADEAGTDLAKYGLDKPARTIALIGENGADLGAILFGKSEGDIFYVKSTASPRVLEVEKSRMVDVPNSRADIEEKRSTDGGAE